MDSTIEERLAFISTLDIEDLAEGAPSQGNASVAGGELASFVAGLTQQQKVSLTL
jgi:hypothetical protein